MKKKEEQMKSNQRKLLIIAILLVLVLVISTVYAWLRITATTEKVNVIRAGAMSLRLDETSANGIKLVNQVPMSYQQGLTTTEYTFELVNDGTIDSSYSIYLDNVATYTNDNGEEVTVNLTNRLGDNLIRMLLLKNNEGAAANKSRLLSAEPGRVIDSGMIGRDQTIKYSLRLWIDSKAGDEGTQTDVMNKIFNGSLRVEAEQQH